MLRSIASLSCTTCRCPALRPTGRFYSSLNITPSPSFLSRSGLGRPRYIKPILFVCGVSIASFVTAAAVYEHQLPPRSLFKARTYTYNLLKEQQNQVVAYTDKLPLPYELRRAALLVINKYYSLSEGRRTALKLIGINTLVFLAWKVPHPALRRFMNSWFVHYPLSGRSVTLITSVFSHQTLPHLLFNMWALWSFGSLLHDTLGREQFLALYLTSGACSSLTSHILSLCTIPFTAMRPSLGASGALYACLAATAALYPNLNLHLLFLPSTAVPIEYAFPALIAIDVVGILARWQIFDHFSHLGGALFGYAYIHLLRDKLWIGMRKKVIILKQRLAVQFGNRW